ncbi:MAG: hypothetical protein KJ587_02745 [Alphaproteobacteria bacterium]|nr:hypothetical protein [Alphaproteobacteria bacterium]
MMPKQRPRTRKARSILSVPLTPEQKSDLTRRAGVTPLSAYARAVLFPANDNAPSLPRRVRRNKDREQLAASILAQLGKSEAASSLREIARGVKLGIIVVTPETDAALRQAAQSVQMAAQAAMRALGVKPR